MAGFEVSYAGALGAGILSFLSPCVLPLIPPYLCFLGGVSLDQITNEEGVDPHIMRRVFIAAVAFVVGFSTVFIALGATASAFGQLLADYLDVLTKIAGVVIIVLGLHFMGIFRLAFLYREARFHMEARPAGVIGAYIIGLAFAFGWTPCIGPILGAILMATSNAASAQAGMIYLSAYSAGLALPFLASTLLINRFALHRQSLGRWSAYARPVAGTVVILMGIAIVSGTMTRLSSIMVDLFPSLATLG